MENMVSMVRANKVTAFWDGNGVANAIFYRTHNKVATVKSDACGFQFPESTEEHEVTAREKLAAFKAFVQENAAQFGVVYDPVDRRPDDQKIPVLTAENVVEYAQKILEATMEKILGQLQNGYIAKAISRGLLAESTAIAYGVGGGVPNINESYAKGGIKYATVTFPVAFAVDGKQYDTTCDVEVVSGQLKKPRMLADGVVMTQTGIMKMLVEAGILPKVEPKPRPKKSEAEDAEAESEGTEE